MKLAVFLVAVLSFAAGCTGETAAPEETERTDPAPAEAREESAPSVSSDTVRVTTGNSGVNPLAHDNPMF